jgi:O-antigen ligase/polysaccharide polymerase Wzy-like membrane protein
MLDLVYPFTIALFWILAFGVVFLPVRWAFFCLVLVTHVSVLQPGFWATETVSWSNAVEALALPMILLFRMTRFRIPEVRWAFPAKVWMALTIYAAISITWSPYKLSGLKMIAYLLGWFVWFLVMDFAWRRRVLDGRLVIAALWAALILACFQTYLLGDPEQAETLQFTSFTPAAPFATFLLSCLAFILFQKNQSTLRVPSIIACLVGVILAADRTALIGLSFILIAWFLHRRGVMGKRSGFRLTATVPALLAFAVVFLGLRGLMAEASPDSRLNELLQIGTRQGTSVEEIGTAAGRLELYARTWSEISGRSFQELLVGSGTSSGGDLASQWEKDLETGLDPNRTIHNEILRTIYEWGLIGLGMAVLLIGLLIKGAWRSAVREGSTPAFAILALIPTVLALLITANPLAGPGSAAGVGLLLILTYGLSMTIPRVQVA